MILELRDKKDLSDARMAKAMEFLADAGATFREKKFRTSVNRSYYAALNAVKRHPDFRGFESGEPRGRCYSIGS